VVGNLNRWKTLDQGDLCRSFGKVWHDFAGEKLQAFTAPRRVEATPKPWKRIKLNTQIVLTADAQKHRGTR